jgi:hypothetical protein
MKETLDQTLDDLLTQSISFKKTGDDEEFSLTVLSSVEGNSKFFNLFFKIWCL